MKNMETVDYNVLANVNTPEDIRKLNLAELNRLASDIRERIISTVSRTGGHLASSLGTVELTLALHYVFNTPVDKIVWDVGHQTYAHKILTGRKDRFDTLRRSDGLSGFPKREESVFDTFNVGHSGTSIAAATGFAEGQHLQGGQARAIAVIGDGSMTTGMAFEALNWSGGRNKDLIIVLNDNEMSISPNVGALSAHLNRVMTGDRVTKLRGELKTFLKGIPGIGEQIFKFSKQIEESMKTFVVPGAIFEELGYIYVGPLEGHRLDYLLSNFENVKKLKGPVLVHVVTQKGRGYRFAEENSPTYHGIAPFDVETGRTLAQTGAAPSYTEIFGRTLVGMAESNPRIVAVTAAMCEGTGLEGFRQKFPARFYDVGIAEQFAVTYSAALAIEGLLPVVAIYSTFLQRAYDQVLHDVCLQNLHVIFAIDRAGFVGEDGSTHQGLFDYSYLRNLPNLIMMAPKDENELTHMLHTAALCKGPVAIRYPRGKGVGAPLDANPVALPIGKGELLSDGSDLTLVAIGSTVHPVLAAAKRLAEDSGKSISVINARFLKPLDKELIVRAAQTTGKMLTVEENVLAGGFGSAVLELLAEEGLTGVTVKRLGVPDEFVGHATQAELRAKYGLDENGIYLAAKALLAQ